MHLDADLALLVAIYAANGNSPRVPAPRFSFEIAIDGRHTMRAIDGGERASWMPGEAPTFSPDPPSSGWRSLVRRVSRLNGAGRTKQ